MNQAAFWQNVTVAGPLDCWLWTRAKHEFGYGVVYIDGVRWKAHRFAYTDRVGPIPAGLDILHACDNPPCCNPAHLKPGTNADNFADMVAKGRHSDRLGTLPDYQLAAELGVSKTVVMRRRQSLNIPSAPGRGRKPRFYRLPLIFGGPGNLRRSAGGWGGNPGRYSRNRFDTLTSPTSAASSSGAIASKSLTKAVFGTKPGPSIRY
jgi:hypothetical protein